MQAVTTSMESQQQWVTSKHIFWWEGTISNIAWAQSNQSGWALAISMAQCNQSRYGCAPVGYGPYLSHDGEILKFADANLAVWITTGDQWAKWVASSHQTIRQSYNHTIIQSRNWSHSQTIDQLITQTWEFAFGPHSFPASIPRTMPASFLWPTPLVRCSALTIAIAACLPSRPGGDSLVRSWVFVSKTT